MLRCSSNFDEVDTGRIISLVSLPDFDPNHRPNLPVRGPAAESPLFNKAIQGVYDLGSSFKIFTVAQALELGLWIQKLRLIQKAPSELAGIRSMIIKIMVLSYPLEGHN